MHAITPRSFSLIAQAREDGVDGNSKRSAFRTTCLTLLCLLFFSLAGAHAREATPDKERFLIDVWDTDQGLPHSTVTSIAQTPDGYSWVGTLNGGLARFVVTRFVTFNPGNTPELSSIEIERLLVDDMGTLWIGTVDGGLTAYRNQKPSHTSGGT